MPLAVRLAADTRAAARRAAAAVTARCAWTPALRKAVEAAHGRAAEAAKADSDDRGPSVATLRLLAPQLRAAGTPLRSVLRGSAFCLPGPPRKPPPSAAVLKRREYLRAVAERREYDRIVPEAAAASKRATGSSDVASLAAQSGIAVEVVTLMATAFAVAYYLVHNATGSQTYAVIAGALALVCLLLVQVALFIIRSRRLAGHQARARAAPARPTVLS
eukprot:PLAT4619.1.p1 GENE.PLAT4619.1~~PLAT4619.1.p1  ORF type:complete len:239 (+),score=91.07 PLAT4619.1:64-717(+)